jgi:hypothetical protein
MKKHNIYAALAAAFLALAVIALAFVGAMVLNF